MESKMELKEEIIKIDFKNRIAKLEKEKSELAEKLKALKIKQAQLLKINQLKENIAKLNSDIKTITSEVSKEE